MPGLSPAILKGANLEGAQLMSSNLTAVDFSNTRVIDLGIGDFHTLALKENGTVMAWGENASGQVEVPTNLKSVIAVAGGDFHSVALQEDGTVAAWGNNEFGQSLVPNGLGNVTQISVGHGRNMALRENGTVVAWGKNL